MAGHIAQKVTDLVGKTPLLELSNLEKKYNLKTRLLAKLEYFNPAGSVKDRIAKAMIDDALATGKITSDSVIIEPTSGNTGIGLASVAASYGLKIILTMPETMSVERRNLLKAYGADVDFETVWGQGHTKAERGDQTEGSSDSNFISWVNECMAK